MAVTAEQLGIALIAATSFLGWLFRQGQARERDVRRQCREANQIIIDKNRMIHARNRYIFRLEDRLSDHDLPFPPRPEPFDFGHDAVKEDDHEQRRPDPARLDGDR